MAFGVGTQAGGVNAIALGQSANASAENAVALGANSVADEANTVSVGATGSERKITHMAAGVADTDGVNVSQLKDTAATTLQQANTYTDEQLVAANNYTDQQIALITNAAPAASSADLDALRAEMNDRFSGVDDRLNSIDDQLRRMNRRMGQLGAMAMATSQGLATPEPGDNFFGVGVGHSEGQNAIAANLRHRFENRVLLSVGVARSSDVSAVGAGVGWAW